MEVPNPVTDLMNDHRLIEAVMTALERKLAQDGAFPGDFVQDALRFFVEYADHVHHHKEEDVLFPALRDRGVQVEGGPIGVMLHEHGVGRKLLAGIRDNLEGARAGSREAQAAVHTCATDYIALLRNHIWKEDNVLFRMASRVLDQHAADEILIRFAQNQRISPEVVEELRRFAVLVS